MKTDSKLFLITTETSGDLLAAQLLKHLMQDNPALCVHGVGGPRARKEGMTTLYGVEDFNVMGLVEVLGNLRRLTRQFNDLVDYCRTFRPDAIVLVDAPDFNIRFAKAVRPLGIPILYYVSPQVWAWRSSRAAQIAQLVDHMMVLFEFEVDLYAKLGLKTTWVGHPLVEEIQGFVKTAGPKPTDPSILIAPGSRPSEVKRHLPIMNNLVECIPLEYRIVLPLAPSLDPKCLADLNPRVDVLPGQMGSALWAADAAVVASGTATLETALFGVPMVVGYRMNSISYQLARRLVAVEHIALANIVLGQRVVPELIQNDFNGPRIWTELQDQLQHADRVRQAFSAIQMKLGGSGAGQRAAQVVGEYL